MKSFNSLKKIIVLLYRQNSFCNFSKIMPVAVYSVSCNLIYYFEEVRRSPLYNFYRSVKVGALVNGQ